MFYIYIYTHTRDIRFKDLIKEGLYEIYELKFS